MRYLRKNTAVTVVIGPLVDWADGKTLLTDNAAFDPSKLHCELVKNSTSETLTLSKTTGENLINLTGYGLATLTLTADNTNFEGELRISLTNAVVDEYSSDLILPYVENWQVYPPEVYTQITTPVYPPIAIPDSTCVFDAAILSADAVLFGVFGDGGGATYTALDGTQTAIHIILGMESTDLDYDEMGKIQQRTREATIPNAEIGAAEIGAAVQVGSVTYIVQRIIRKDVSVTTCEIRRLDEKGKMETSRAKKM